MSIPELELAKEKTRQVIELLRQNKIDRWADKLQDYLNEMVGWYKTKERLYDIGAICHPRAMGDAMISGMSHLQWTDNLSDLKQACAIAFNLLERMSEKDRDQI